jgi:DNA-binding NarL/FixJ family response regulator
VNGPAAPVIEGWRPDATTVEILRALSTGRSATEAAVACHVSERTLRRKVREAQRHWGTETVLATVVRAVRQGLI